MCSVIEIKNANEYYIRYHGPESMQQQQQQQQQEPSKEAEVNQEDSQDINEDSKTGDNKVSEIFSKNSCHHA